MVSRFPRADLSRIKTVSIRERGGLVRLEDFVRPCDLGEEVDALFGVIPDLLSGADFKAAVKAVVGAAQAAKPVLLMFGAHVVKCGLSRLVIDLMERGVVTAVATNGAGAIHDFEIAMWGLTSEDVAANIVDGRFGMCKETAELMNGAAVAGQRDGLGLGEALGRAIAEAPAPNVDASIAGRAFELGIPLTVHVALGTDIIHQHPSADGAALGETTMADFLIMAELVRGLEGGAIVNIGSAVILPEVFLKALAVARNLGGATGGFAAVSMDMNDPYRAMANVVERPTAQSGMGVALRGRHELLFPLFWAGVVRSSPKPEGPPES
jgi:hypothetical protein